MYGTQYLYTLLLRRILGPLLDDEANRTLYDSIEKISIHDGIYVFTEIGLNAQYITSLIHQHQIMPHEHINFAIRQATIHRLEIQLSIQENYHHASTTSATSSSFAWRAIQLGQQPKTKGGGVGGVSLVAKIIVDGLSIEIEPFYYNRNNRKGGAVNHQTTQQHDNQMNQEINGRNHNDEGEIEKEAQKNKKSFISDYIDAALASLRLSVEIKNFWIRLNSFASTSSSSSSSSLSQIHNHYDHHHHESWIQLRIYSCSYCDAAADATVTNHRNYPNDTTTFGYRTKMHKVLSFHDRITIITGDRYLPSSHDDDDDRNSSSKATIFSRISNVMSADTNKNKKEWIDDNVSMMGMLEGPNESSSAHQIAIRVIEYDDNRYDDEMISSSTNDANHNNQMIQQDISITIQQSINVSVDVKSMEQIQTIIHAFTTIMNDEQNDESIIDDPNVSATSTNDDTIVMNHDDDDNDTNDDNKKNTRKEEDHIINDDDDDQDWKVIHEFMMKQYEEARILAERGEVTGGILVPSIRRNSNGMTDVTYDTFFDANDGSFSQYATDLRNSILAANHSVIRNGADHQIHGRRRDDGDWCHTKFRFYIKEGGLKVSFQPNTPRPEEYILLTFSEWNLSSSVSFHSSEHHVSIHYLDIEDSNVTATTTTKPTTNDKHRVIEVSSMLRFHRAEIREDFSSYADHDDDVDYDNEDEFGHIRHDKTMDSVFDDDDEGIMIQSNPCISLMITKNKKGKGNNYDDGISFAYAQPSVPILAVDVELTLEPMEVTFRPSTILKIINFAQEVTKRETINNDTTATTPASNRNSSDTVEDLTNHDATINDMEHTLTNFNFFCTSMTVECLTNLEEVITSNNNFSKSRSGGNSWSRLYDRCGYSIQSYRNNVYASTANKTVSSSLATTLENVSIEVILCDHHDANTYTFNCHNAIMYATSSSQYCFDILALCGRNEVNPSLPVSIQLWHKHSNNMTKEENTNIPKEQNPGSLSVPKVLQISAFKARQNDDDEEDGENEITDDSATSDWVISSSPSTNTNKCGTQQQQHSNNLVATIRSGLDPQLDMINIASTCNYVITFHIPELMTDLTVNELLILHQMINSIQIVENETDQYHDTYSNEDDDKKNDLEIPQTRKESNEHENTDGMNIALSLTVDFATVALHGEVPCSVGTTLSQNVSSCSKMSYCSNINQLKLHTVLIMDECSDTANSTTTFPFRHARFLLQDVDFYEISNLVRPIASPNPFSLNDRKFKLIDRSRCHSGSFATPIFHRSYLFSPMSKSNPIILLDIINLATDLADIDVSQINVYFTLYDVTYRFNYDSQWIQRLLSIVPESKKNTDHESDLSNTEQNKVNSVGKVTSVLRVFLSVADCNVDYCSPTRFKTASRTILRIGDFRISSNIARPQPFIQAYRVSVGDVSVFLCNSRYLYNYENKHLLRSENFMREAEFSLRPLGLPRDCDSSAVVHAMNYRTILVLDSLDSNISLTNGKPKDPIDAYVTASFKIGEIRVVACKDSFALFMATITEVTTEISTINDNEFNLLKNKVIQISEQTQESDFFYDPQTDDIEQRKYDDEEEDEAEGSPHFCKVDGTISIPEECPSFLLDGYDWTAIETVKSNSCDIPDGEEQAARWYGNECENGMAKCQSFSKVLVGIGMDYMDDMKTKSPTGPNFLAYHLPLQPVSDPIGDGDMNVPAFAGLSYQPQIKTRIMIHNLTIRLVFFDGYDWPELVKHQTPNLHNAFVIPDIRQVPEKGSTLKSKRDAMTEKVDSIGTNVKLVRGRADALKINLKETIPIERRKTTLLKGLLDKNESLFGDIDSSVTEPGSLFQDVPLAEERVKKMKEEAELRRLSRNAGKYVQVNISGVSMRMDSLEDSDEHRLVSCLNFKANDFFVAETISNSMPVKMAGEWLDEDDHPRDTKDGLLMFKLVTWHPTVRITPDNEVANDESEATIKILPLRCILDQRAIAFIRALFTSDNDSSTVSLQRGLHPVPPPLFRSLRMRSFKLKVDYTPQEIDASALRNGALVELVNLLPIDRMVLTLQAVSVKNEIGLGEAMSVVVRRWVEDICSTQLAKFVTNARPFEPVTQVGGAAVDMVVMPYDAFSKGQNVKKALRVGAKTLSKTLVAEAITVTSRTARLLAGTISKVAALNDQIIPERPQDPPKDFADATPHAVAAISRGLQLSNQKIIIIPYREYQRSGVTGAVTSVLKGVPVAVAAPASATAEAVSFGLIGIRNQLRPDIRKEEEFVKFKNYLFDK